MSEWTGAKSTTVTKDYKSRYKHMRNTIKQLILENGALSYEIESVENKLVSAKIERKALLKRLLQFEKPENKSVKSTQKKNTQSSGSKDAASFTSITLEEDVNKKTKRIKVE